MNKETVAAILNEIGLMLDLKGENPFKSRAYANAARAIQILDDDLDTAVKKKALDKIPGIGKAISEKITELVTTGELEYYTELKTSIPDTLLDLLKVPGLGPKRVKTLHDKLNITSIGELEYACAENRLLDLPGFGKKMQDNILAGIGTLNEYRGKYLFAEAYEIGMDILNHLRKLDEVLQSDLAGSIRRCKEVVKDLDILCSSGVPAVVMDYFTSLPQVQQIIAKGETKSSVRLKDGIAVDLRVVSPDEYPYALHHFTGSKEHNTALRHFAKQRGMKINEYGLFEGQDQKLIKCTKEKHIFNALGMEYIPPELRENMGEIEKALEGGIPTLVQQVDIKGLFHIHTNYSDGVNSIEDLADHAYSLGYSYICINDHSKAAYYANGLTEEKIIMQHNEIDRVNQKYKNFKVLKGIEADILKDGSVDYDHDILSKFDFVIASVHSSFNMSREEMTQRILRALDNPYVKILGHPTGRLLLSREGYDIDMEAIITKAAQNKIAIEINASPYRLDLDWRWCKRAKEAGVKLVISPDAHNLSGFSFVSHGISMARKGWLEKKDIINSMDLHELYKGW